MIHYFVLFGKMDKVPILPKTKKKLEKKRLGPLLGTLIVYQQPKDRYAKEFMTRSAWSRRIGARGNLPVLLDGRLVQPSSRRRSEKVAKSLASVIHASPKAARSELHARLARRSRAGAGAHPAAAGRYHSRAAQLVFV